MSPNHLMSAVTDLQPPKLQNKMLQNGKTLDTGCTLGAGAEHDTDCVYDTSLLSERVFMLLDKTKMKQ